MIHVPAKAPDLKQVGQAVNVALAHENNPSQLIAFGQALATVNLPGYATFAAKLLAKAAATPPPPGGGAGAWGGPVVIFGDAQRDAAIATWTKELHPSGAWGAVTASQAKSSLASIKTETSSAQWGKSSGKQASEVADLLKGFGAIADPSSVGFGDKQRDDAIKTWTAELHPSKGFGGVSKSSAAAMIVNIKKETTSKPWGKSNSKQAKEVADLLKGFAAIASGK